MAVSQSVRSELLDVFRTGDGVDMIRESVRTLLQELVEFEASSVIGAERYESTEDRVTERNGPRSKLLATKAGDVELRIPKFRKGSFFPSILEPRRRIGQALYAVVMEAYVHGISTRKGLLLIFVAFSSVGIALCSLALKDAVQPARMRCQRSADEGGAERRQCQRERCCMQLPGRGVFEPGWRWSTDVKPIARTESCQTHHQGICLSGQMTVQLNDDTEITLGPGM